MTDIAVALEAMRSDAAAWESAADRVDGPRTAIDGFALTGADVSKWAVDAGLDRTYDDARRTMESLLAQASATFRLIGEQLRAAADTYEREDEANMHALNKIVE
ncbi:type VII secretion target [Actinosynnema sp. NPDC047251]|uniref:ESX-1 secretion-associated protein n=1 Tax=Saccharothrix espanaensis (strain ATCC 51144 / DSM 44229 / JCM 9112 / NBRC 15066 / NRRL 15764) TaxID=1179773 RepID=K0JUI5_SACES|nr:type VII secretion target [Saccharothrix espanaensis]CCH29152.1 hypothetical protein BN6_18320 [Saccharothrix espanaensis DSM 44229]